MKNKTTYQPPPKKNSLQMPLPGDFGDFDFDDGGVCEGHGAVGDGLDAEGNLVAVVEHDGIEPGGTFL